MLQDVVVQTELSVKSSWIWGRCTPLFLQFRIFVGSTTASWTNTTVRYRNPKGIDIIDDFLPLILTIQHDGPKQRDLLSPL